MDKLKDSWQMIWDAGKWFIVGSRQDSERNQEEKDEGELLEGRSWRIGCLFEADNNRVWMWQVRWCDKID